MKVYFKKSIDKSISRENSELFSIIRKQFLGVTKISIYYDV